MNVMNIVSDKAWGGIEQLVLDLSRALRADGFATGVITRNFPAVYEPFRADNLLCAAMPLRGISAMLAPVRMASILNKLSGPVSILTYTFKDASIALQARRLSKNPGDIRVSAIIKESEPAKTSPSYVKMYAELDTIAFTSQDGLNKFLSSSPLIDRDRIHVVSPSSAMEPIQAKATDNEVAEIVYASRIVPENGLDTLIKALGQVSRLHWHLTVCGTGIGRHVMPIVRSARALGINDRISWEGHVEDVKPFLEKADIAVVPSKNADSLGMAVLEAASQGCAIIAANTDIHRSLLADGETALFTAPESPDSLAEALNRLIENAELRKKIASAAKSRFIGEHSFAHFYGSILSLLRQRFG